LLTAEQRTVAIPVDIIPASASEQVEIATYARREDWLSATGALPKGALPIFINVALPVATFSRWTARQKHDAQSSPKNFQWVMTPNATWSPALLSYLQEVLSLGYPVTCSLRCSRTDANTRAQGPKSVAITLPIHSVVLRFRGQRHGFYFEPNMPLDLRGLREETASNTGGLLGKHLTNEELFLKPTVTHIVAPTHADAIRRVAFAVPARHVQSIVRDIAQGGSCGKIPLIETKTPVFRYYADIDLYWDIYKSFDAYTELKKLQLQFFGADAEEAFANLGDLLGWMYPLFNGKRPRAMASRRSQYSSSKDGYHVVFPDVLLPNDGRTGGLVTGQLEMSAARALSRGHLSEPLRFLVHMLLNDWQHLGERMSPITCRVRGSAIASVGATTREDLRAAITANLIVSLRDRDVQLSDQHSAELIAFALKSMGPPSLDRHLDRILGAPTFGARGTALSRLARRCVWEIRRRARLFDRSVYAPTMGLRMLGTRKPGDVGSAYVPMNGDALTVESIAAHSIRAPKTVPSVPGFRHSRLLHASGLGLNGRKGYSPQALDGLLMKAREEERATLPDLMLEFQIHPRLPAPKACETVGLRLMSGQHKDEKTSPSILEVAATLASNAKLNGALSFAPFLAKYQEIEVPERGRLNVYPPPRHRRRVLKDAQDRSKGARAEIKVRVFIPSPAISAAGNAYGGDDRGPQYTGGTSRLDITVTINLTTSEVSYQATWGKTTEYDWDDTFAVPGKPSWWLGQTPGAQPVDSGRLQVTSDNVRVSASSGEGKTTVAICYSGVNPLSPVAHTTDGNFAVSFNADESLTIRAIHDGFPAHTIYVNGTLVYHYDPIARGGGPGALAGCFDESTVTFPYVPSGQQRDGGQGGGASGGAGGAGDPSGGGGPADAGGAGTGDPDDAGPQDGDEIEGAMPGDVVDTEAPETTEYPMVVVRNADGSVTITVRDGSGEFSENLTYDEDGQWTSQAGSAVTGGPDLFDDTGGWSLIEDAGGLVSLTKRRKRSPRR
jgi:hypothetical protein